MDDNDKIKKELTQLFRASTGLAVLRNELHKMIYEAETIPEVPRLRRLTGLWEACETLLAFVAEEVNKLGLENDLAVSE